MWKRCERRVASMLHDVSIDVKSGFNVQTRFAQCWTSIWVNQTWNFHVTICWFKAFEEDLFSFCYSPSIYFELENVLTTLIPVLPRKPKHVKCSFPQLYIILRLCYRFFRVRFAGVVFLSLASCTFLESSISHHDCWFVSSFACSTHISTWFLPSESKRFLFSDLYILMNQFPFSICIVNFYCSLWILLPFDKELKTIPKREREKANKKVSWILPSLL